MCIKIARWSAAALCAFGLVLPAGVAAQTLTPPPPGGIGEPPRAERPYRGLFGGGFGNTSQKLTLETSIGGGLHGSGNTGDLDTSGGGPAPNGGMMTVNARLDYLLSQKKFGLEATAGSYGDYDPRVEGMLAKHTATLTMNLVPTSSTNVTISQGFKNVPEFSVSEIFPIDIGPIVPLAQDVQLSQERYRRYGANVDVMQNLTRRTRLDLGAGWGRGVITTGVNWTVMSYSAQIEHSISRGLGVYAGYRYSEQTNGGGGAGSGVDRHPTINLGINFGRPLSLTRRTKLSFGAGVAQVRDQLENHTSNQLVGSAALTREFGRTWALSGGYSRAAQYVESLATPVFSDTVRAGVSGNMTERIRFGAGFGGSRGQFGSPGERGSAFDTFFGNVQVGYDLNQFVSLGADMAYTKLAGALPISSPDQMYPVTIRGHVRFFMPLFTRSKRPS